MPYIIISVTTETDYRLRLVYSDGSIVVVDFTPIIQQGGVYSCLSEPEFFSQVSLAQGGRYIQWPNELDFCADSLWFEVHPNNNRFRVAAIHS